MPRFLRPPPVRMSRAPFVDPRLPIDDAAAHLAAGHALRLTHHYGLGADILDALDQGLGPVHHLRGEDLRQEKKRRRHLASGLLVPIERGRVCIEGAVDNPLLAQLYPDIERFWLPLVDVQALQSSAWRHNEGMHFAVLGHRLHPWHGVYAPKRTVHLELLATWLAGYEGAREHAIDVGTGCGVLAFQLARAGFSRVTACDINPNALESVARDVARQPSPPPVDLVESDLLEAISDEADLIVFNPPWIPGRVDSPLDRALFYDDDLFERFFAQAHRKLATGGRVVLVFSSVLRLLHPDAAHPIDAELDRGRFVLERKLQRRVKGQGRRTKERVEVWVLAPAE